jgi:hypothetical protein
MQNVKTLQIHYNTNLDFDVRSSDFYSGSWEFHTQASNFGTWIFEYY